jgi:hypothetical protein
MTDKSIENLPDEVLLQVFSKLDGKSLKESSLVSNRYRSIEP